MSRFKPALPCLAAFALLGGACLPVSLEGRVCAADGDCLEGFRCRASVCVATPSGGVCASDDDCADGTHCAFAECLANDKNPRADQLLVDDCPAFVTDPGGGDIDVEDATSVQLVGSLLPLTKAGVANGPGIGRTAAIELAARQLNTAGGIFGRRLVVLACNSDGNVDTAKRALAHLAAAGIPAVVGEAASGITQAAFSEVARPAGMLMVAPSSTSVNLTGLEDDGLLFRTTVSDVAQGAALARFLLDGGFQRIAVVASRETYGATLRVNVRDTLCAPGAYPCGNASRYLPMEFVEQPAQPQIDDVVTDLVAFDPEIVLLIGQDAEVTPILSSIAATPALGETRLLLTDTAKKDNVLGPQPRDLVERVRGTAPASTPESETFNDFNLELNAVYGPELFDGFSPHAYDAAIVVALAHVAHGDVLHPRGADLALAMTDLATSGAPPIKTIGLDDAGLNSLQEGIGDLARGDAIDLDGASGPLDFDANGDVLGDIELWRRCPTAGGDTQVSLGVALTAAGEERVVDQTCPSCDDVGCPDGAECAAIFLDGDKSCLAPCATLSEPCTTALGDEGFCAARDGASVCLVFANLNELCGDRFHAACDSNQAGLCLPNAVAPGDLFEGYCMRPCNPADPATCRVDGLPAAVCGCGADGLECSVDLVITGIGDGFCTPPLDLGETCAAEIGEAIALCTEGACIDETCQ